MMMLADQMTLGELVKRQRLLAGWSQENLARRLGRSVATISALETDRRFPAAALVPEIAKELRIDKRRIVALMMRRHGGNR